VRDLELGVQDLEVGRRLDVGGRDRAGALLREMHLDLGRVAVEPADELLQVQDDVGDVLPDARQRGELVRDAFDLDGGHRRALERREQDAPQRVAERVPEAAVERLDHEPPRALVGVLGDELGHLEVDQGRAGGHGILSGRFLATISAKRAEGLALLRVELDDQGFLDGRVDLGALRPLEYLAGEPVVVGLEPGRDRGREIGGVADDPAGLRA
jgi:hypothetical protein